jgi:FkbM family methyltransferase
VSKASSEVGRNMQVTIRGRELSWVAEHYPGFWSKAERGVWEPDTFSIIDRHVESASTVLDLGANIGAITLYAAQEAKRVICFEPDPISRDMLLDNIAANPKVRGKIEVVAKAVHPSGQLLKFGSKGLGGDSMSTHVIPELRTFWIVPTIKPDEIAAMLPDTGPVFVKIDIEGGEYDVVPAACTLWQRKDVTVLLSMHPDILRAAGKEQFVELKTREVFLALRRFRAGPVGLRANGELESLVHLASSENREWLFTAHSRV